MFRFSTGAPRLWSFVGGFAAALLCSVFVTNFLSGTGEKEVVHQVHHVHSLDDPLFAHELGVLVGPTFTPGNTATVLLNGDEIFPPMLEAIRGARESLTFETYIWGAGDMGRRFAAAIADAGRRGVRCHVLLDWVGAAKMDTTLIDQMTAAGVEVQRFHPLDWYNVGRLNNRTHRKLLIVDGRVGFTGGVGISEEWRGHAQDPAHWRDTSVRIEGPVVAQMQSVFLDNWIKLTGHVLHGHEYFPDVPEKGTSRAQMFSSSPAGGSESMQLMYLFSIAGATRSIDLSAAYFVPDDLTLEALVAAMRRGVKVRIVVPGAHIDSETVRLASRARWGPLLLAGATIAEYAPTMFHCKVMIVDGLLTSVGSTNFDNRSFRLNDEATLNILDADFALQQTQVFERDLSQSRRIGFVEWASRPWTEKVHERIVGLIGSQL